VEALVLLSLVERVESQKADKNKRIECRSVANELCVLAAQIDPSCAMALNHLANYSFHNWRLVHPSGVIASPRLLVLSSVTGVPTLQVGDMVQIRKAFVTTIAAVLIGDDQIELTLETDAPREWVGDTTLVEMKDTAKINEVKTLTTRALRATNNPSIKAESFYIFGRLYHMIRDYEIAFQLYEEALNLQPEMPLAAFGLGQLYMAKQDYASALEKFNSVLARQPDDRDTQAYVMLLQSIHKKESASFDKLREIAPGFAFEADLWLSQGHTIQMKGPGEYPTALRCYEMAHECMLKQNLSPQSRMLLNMGILYHSLGNLASANDFVRRSLAPNLVNSDEPSAASLIFHRPENNIFYEWETAAVTVVVEEGLDDVENGIDLEFNVPISQLCVVSLSEEYASQSFPEQLKIGDDILVADVVMEVLHVTATKIHCKGFWSTLDRGTGHTFKIKKSHRNCNYSTMTNCFALARIQEDRGHIQAAREIYIELLKLRPTFLEC
jgi:tetratricopeptide (TPR) repeat protein